MRTPALILLYISGLNISGALAQTYVPPPYINGHSIRNAASYLPPALASGAIAQGSIFSLFGSALGPAAGLQALTYPLQTTLGGVAVSIVQGKTTVAALPIYVSATQVNIIMPSNAPLGPVSVQVSYNGQTSNFSPVTAVASSFGIFSVNSAGVGPGIVTDYISATSQPLNSLAAGAAPGQLVIIWGTGLGAVPSDINPPAAGNLPVQTEVFVGGVSAPLSYNGRSPCCSGLDQIAVTLPANVPTGCYVPVVVRTAGTTVSNAVTMAISAQPGAACSEAFNPLEQPFINGRSVGIVALERLDQTVNVIVSAGGEAVSDYVTAAMFQSSPNPYFFQALFSLPPQGSCTIYAADTNLISSLIFPAEIAGPQFIGAQLLNAGNTISISNGSSVSVPAIVPLQRYDQLLGGAGSPVFTTPLFFNPPNPVQVSGTGGSNVGAFSVSVPTAAPLQWTNQSSFSTVSPSQPLTVNWSASGSSGGTALIAGGNYDPASRASSVFICTAPASAGTFTVPTWALASIPATATNATQAYGAILLGLAPLTAPTTFTASGLNAGYAIYLPWLSQSVIWQ
jgi:uncharacterized protein (TIGR03437 family)